MNKVKFIIIIFVSIFILMDAQAVQAAKTQINSDISIEGLYNYVWRGQLIDQGMVLQPSIGTIIEGVGAKMWENYDLSTLKITRNEFRLSYNTQSETLKFSMGLILYGRATLNDTMEGYITIGEFSQLNTSITLYYDFIQGHGAFVSTSYQHTFGEESQITFKGSLNVNVGDKVMGYDETGAPFTGLYNGEASFFSDLPLGTSTFFRPNGAISVPLSTQASHAISSLSQGGSSVNYYFGAMLLFRY